MRNKRLPGKLVLFTKKSETSPMLKGLGSIYRDRLDIAEVKDSAKDIVEQEGISDLPKLVLYTRVGQGKIDKVIYEGTNTLENVREWLEPAALKDKKLEEVDSASASIDESSTEEIKVPFLTQRIYETKVLKEEKFVLIHIYKDEEAGSWDAIRTRFGTMMDYYNLKLNNKEAEAFAKDTLKATKFPIFKLLPLGITKKPVSKLFFNPEIEIKEMVKEVIEFITDNSISIGERDLQMHLQSSFGEKKNALIYFYNKGSITPSYNYFAALSKYTETIKFFSLKDPSDRVLEGFNLKKSDLPKIAMVLIPKEEDIEKLRPKKRDKKGKVKRLMKKKRLRTFRWLSTKENLVILI